MKDKWAEFWDMKSVGRNKFGEQNNPRLDVPERKHSSLSFYNVSSYQMGWFT